MAGKRYRRVRDAVHVAEAQTGLQFCVYLGPTPEAPRALAERLFASAEAEAHPAVLIVVATNHRKVEILTAPWVRQRIPDDACEAAIELMRPGLRTGSYGDALVAGIRHLATVAGTGGPRTGGVQLPDLFDET